MIIAHPDVAAMVKAPIGSKAISAGDSWTKINNASWKNDKTNGVSSGADLKHVTKLALAPGGHAKYNTAAEVASKTATFKGLDSRKAARVAQVRADAQERARVGNEARNKEASLQRGRDKIDKLRAHVTAPDSPQSNPHEYAKHGDAAREATGKANAATAAAHDDKTHTAASSAHRDAAAAHYLAASRASGQLQADHFTAAAEHKDHAAFHAEQAAPPPPDPNRFHKESLASALKDLPSEKVAKVKKAVQIGKAKRPTPIPNASGKPVKKPLTGLDLPVLDGSIGSARKRREAAAKAALGRNKTGPIMAKAVKDYPGAAANAATASSEANTPGKHAAAALAHAHAHMLARQAGLSGKMLDHGAATKHHEAQSKLAAKVTLAPEAKAELTTIVNAGNGTGLSTGALDDPINVKGDIQLACKLLAEGKHIRLNKVDEVGTLLDKLSEFVNDAIAKGEKAPNYNLCLVSVPKTNLFCAESKGVPRVKMPQLGGTDIRPGSPADALPRNDRGGVGIEAQFAATLKAMGVGVEEKNVKASSLKASQNELNGLKVAGISAAMDKGLVPEEPIYVTRDGYVIDGHHRWAAKVAVDARHGDIGKIEMPVRMIDMEIGAALDFANAFANAMGLLPADASNVPATKKA